MDCEEIEDNGSFADKEGNLTYQSEDGACGKNKLIENNPEHIDENNAKSENNSDNVSENENPDTVVRKNKLDIHNSTDNEEESDDEIGHKKKTKTSILYSDSEDESVADDIKKETQGTKKPSIAILDSSSDKEFSDSDIPKADQGDENNHKSRKGTNLLNDSDFESDDDSKPVGDHKNNNNANDDETKNNNTISDNDELNTNENDGLSDTEGHQRTLKKKKPGRLKKNELVEMKSEQQRMLREQKCEIPYHEPQVKSVKEFLKRVPTLSNRRTKSLPFASNNGNENNEIDLTGSAKKKSLFDMKPILRHNDTNGDLEFVDDVVIKKSCTPPARKSNHLDKFMKKVEKHMVKKTALKERTSLPDDTESAHVLKPIEKNKTSQGTSHLHLKSQLKEKIRKTRQKQYNDLQSQRDKLEEQIALEEESFGEDEDETDSDDNDEDSGDEEIDKWNLDDERIRLEESMAEVENEAEKEDEHKDKGDADEHGESVDFNIHGDTSHSSVKNNLGKFSTPLLKSNLLDTTSDNFTDAQKPLSLPCENTQDLYKSESRVSSQDSDSETELGPNFHLSLDEDTQVTQSMLDSQGFFKINRKEEKQISPVENCKNLFPTDLKGTDNISMTQMLGLCSGKFGNDAHKKSEETNKNLNNEFKASSDDMTMTQMLGLCSGKFENNVSNTNTFPEKNTDIDDRTLKKNFKDTDSMSMTQMLGLCSGKFEDDPPNNTSPKKNQETDKSFNMSFRFDHSNEAMSFQDSCGKFGGFSTQEPGKKSITNLSQALEEAKNKECTANTIKDNDNKIKEQSVPNVSILEGDKDSVEDGIAEEQTGGRDSDEENDVDNNEEDEENEDGNEEGYDEEEEEEEEEEEVPEELQEWNMHMTNHAEKEKKKKWKKKAFYEEEAELSGSDVGSDEEELGSEFDEYEIDSEAEQDVPSREKLKKQLHKIHQRKMNDQDKHEMRLLQELYLEDGELGGGEKRKRNFRWRNIDENYNENSQSYEVDEGDNYSELKERNQDLVDRNKFLMERDEENKAIELDENSQMILEKIQAVGLTKGLTPSQPLSAIDNSQITKAPLRRSGSFLRGSEHHSQSPTSTAVPVVSKVGNKSAKSFVYQALEDTKPKSKKTKKDMNEEGIKSFPPSKKQKLNDEPNNNINSKRKKTPGSIFSHL